MKSLTDRARAATEVIEGINSLEEVPGAVKRIQEIFGVAHLSYHATALPNVTDRGPFIASTYDKSWIRRYIDQDYQSIDPVVIASLRGFIPIDWQMLDFSSKKRLEFMEEAREFDISAQGMTFPIRGPSGEHALVSINTSHQERHWDKFVGDYKSDFLLITHFLHNRIRSLKEGAGDDERIALSERELDVLHWLARGKTYEDVGQILSISARTVRAYIESARFKLNAVNTTQAVATALSRNLISPLSTR